MSYYKKIPVLDEQEQLEFDTYLLSQYSEDWYKSLKIAGSCTGDTRFMDEIALRVFDKLATPRIYLLREWIHRKQQEKAGVETE